MDFTTFSTVPNVTNISTTTQNDSLLRRGGGSAMTLYALYASTTICCDGSEAVLAALLVFALSIGELEDEFGGEPRWSMTDEFSLAT